MSDKHQPFQLYECQVPDLPEAPQWPDILRWMICVMDYDDKALPFVAGVYAYVLDHDGDLTEKQEMVATRIMTRVVKEFMACTLVCQNSQKPARSKPPFDLSSAEPKGAA